MKNIIIRIIVVLMFFMLIQPFFINTMEVKAVGVVGSNALKSVVIGAQEKAGIQYASKSAKEKAFDAWNMKAYESWLEAERTGKNKELWDEWNKIHSNPEQYIKIEPVPDKPGLGRVLLDTTIYGMAIGIGADIGFAIENAYTYQSYIDAIGKDSNIRGEGYGYNRALGLRSEVVQEYIIDAGITYKQERYYFKNGTTVGYVSSYPPLKGYIVITGYKPSDNGRYIDYDFTSKSYKRNKGIIDYNIITGSSKFYLPDGITAAQYLADNLIDGHYPYEFTPREVDLPLINPVPGLEPLIKPNPDLDVIPEVIPPGVIEILVPLDPEVDPFWEGVINEPHDLPIPDPGTDPGTDPGNLPEPEPIPDPFPEPTKEVKPEDLSCERVKRPDFDQLGNAFSNAFPFSLPFDIHRFFKASFENIDDKKPEFELSFLGNGVILTIPNEFDALVKYLKGFILIMFDISLLYLFARFMRKGTD